jgi:hypothetical protein
MTCIKTHKTRPNLAQLCNSRQTGSAIRPSYNPPGCPARRCRSGRQLATLVPAPRVHLVRFHRVLAPVAPWRPLITQLPAVDCSTPFPKEVTKEELGGAMTHNSTSGVAHFIAQRFC